MEMRENSRGDIVDLRGAAYVLGLKPAQVIVALEHDDIPARRIAGEWRFEREALKRWVAEGSSSRYTPPFYYSLTAFSLSRREDIASWLL